MLVQLSNVLGSLEILHQPKLPTGRSPLGHGCETE